MKKVIHFAILAFVLALVASCAGPLPGAGGTFTLKVTLAQGAAGRTVVPDLGDAVKSYRLNLTSRSGHVPREMVSQGSTLTFEGLHAGTWDLQGQALDAEGTVLAEKTLTGQTLAASGTLDLTLALDPTVRTGTGTLDLILEWPESSGVDGLTVSLLAGEASVEDPQPTVTIPTFVAGSSRTANILRTDLAAGTYSLVLKFTRAGKDAGTFREAVNVTANLITRLWIDPADGKLVTVRSFTPGDFLGAQTSLAGLAVSGVQATDFTFASETTNYIIPQVPTTKPLTFTATQGMSGQNLEYQWNSEETWQTGDFGVLSRPLTLKAGDNKLTLKVTAPDRTNFKTYTLTFHWTPSFVSPTGMEMVQVEGGTFQRDAVATNLSTVDTFLMGRYEVTREQWLEVMGYNPIPTDPNLLKPVGSVTWYDALEFCNILSEREGLTPVYTITNRIPSAGYPITSATVAISLTARGYRLPTNNEWSWAAMGGLRDSISSNWTNGRNLGGWDKNFAGSNNSNSLFDYAVTNAVGFIQTLGTKLPNELGIYDLSGNVQEMLYETTDPSVSGPVRNLWGVLGSGGTYYIGGTYQYDEPGFVNLSRGYHDTVQKAQSIGFRVARSTIPLQKITYNTNGSSPNKSFSEAYDTGDATTILGNASNATPPAGKTFNRWSGWVNGTSDDYLPGQSFTMPESDKTLYAQWTDPGAAVKARIIQSGTGASTVEDLAVDGEGNLYAVGMIYGQSLFDFGNGVNASAGNAENNAYLAKFNKFGQAQWVFYPKTAPGSSQFNAVAVDEAGRIFAGGWQSGGKFVYQSTEAYELESFSGTRNATLFCLDSKGQVLWGSSAQKGAQEELLQSEILDLKVYKDQVFAVGYQTSFYNGNKLTVIPYHYGTVKTATVVSSPFLTAGVLLSLDTATGAINWGQGLKSGSETGQYEYSALSVDESGIYVAGNYWSDLTYLFKEGSIGPGFSGVENALLAKYTLSGNEVWIVHPVSPPGKSKFKDVLVQGALVYAVGYQLGNTQFTYAPGNKTFTAGAEGDINAVLLSAVSTSGEVFYVGGTKDAYRSEFYRILPGTDGKSLFISGHQPPGEITKQYFSEGSIKIPGAQAGYGNAGFIAKVSVEDPNNLKVLSSRFFASDNSFDYYIHSLAVDPDGSVYAGALLVESSANAVFNAGAGVTVTKTYPGNGNGLLIKYLP